MSGAPALRAIDAGEVRLRAAVQGEGPLVLMVHGFPESWYSWRHQPGPGGGGGGVGRAVRAAARGPGPRTRSVHGCPEGWYSWRHQLGPVGEAGFTAAAIDVRGYGGS